MDTHPSVGALSFSELLNGTNSLRFIFMSLIPLLIHTIIIIHQISTDNLLILSTTSPKMALLHGLPRASHDFISTSRVVEVLEMI